MAKSLHLLQGYHPIIGMVTISSLTLFQPAMGFFQHRNFLKTGKKSAFAYMHRWFGRTIIILGIINAGLGLRFAKMNGVAPPAGAIIAFSVVAGIVGLVYVSVVGFLPRMKRGESSC